MKKIILVFVFAFPMLVLNAQGVRFSFMANPQLTWFSGSDQDYQANGTFPAINIGVELDAFFSENYAFSTGISINNLRGGAIYNDSLIYDFGDEEKILPADSRMTYNIQYINIPLGLKFKTIEIGYTTYWINTGLTPMFRIKASTTDESGNFDDTEFKDEIRLFNMNYFIEGGVEYSLGGNTAIVGGIGYYSGFFDITENSSYRLTSSAFAITLGLQF